MKQVNEKPLMSVRNRKPSGDERGFTLIETVVSLVIMMIVGLGGEAEGIAGRRVRRHLNDDR